MAARKLKVFSTSKVGQYEIPGHPEQPARVLASLQHLKNILPAETFEEPKPASLEKIGVVHGPHLITDVERETYFDPDTPGTPGIYAASLLSAGGALKAAEESLKGAQAFSLMRPPGHHATPDKAMGFCYFNSMAVAVQDMVKQGKVERVSVLDLDCHHGNGTEDFCLEKSKFQYVSLHQFPAYPGTGRQSRANCINYPLPPGTEEGDYFQALEAAFKNIQNFKPGLIGVSMGFDTYEKDPLTQFGLVKKDYRKIGKWLRDLSIPTFALLEGGYHDDLPFLIEEFLTGWTQ
jgi:acetoin utilization deacetylase AcuC-like enzyme